MKKQLVNVLSIILILAFVFSIQNLNVSADKAGKCGENLSWSYNLSTKTLTFSGEGDMITDKNAWYYKNWKKVKNVVIEQGVTSVVSFIPSGELNSLKIADSVTAIYDEAMLNVSLDKKFQLPKKLEHIGRKSLPACKNLTLYIPSTVQYIEKNALWSNGYKKFIVDEKNEFYKSINGIVYDKAVTKMVLYPYKKTSNTYTTPKTLLRIDDGIISSRYLHKIVVTKNIEYFGSFYVYYGFKKSALKLFVFSKTTKLSPKIEKNKYWGENCKLTVYYKYNNKKKTFYQKGSYTL